MLTKLISGGLRVGVSKPLVQRAIARHAGLDAKRVAQRMMGWTHGRMLPSVERLQALLAVDDGTAPSAGQLYPFFLAHALDVAGDDLPTGLGPTSD